ncbi:hypothetical protein [Cellulomonas sp. C5510]|uniref:hypothetical protein n=1 Tax=Cellulomonas sp. C5510 TaxID=2871170 RepID=UPI001C959A4F|nr:hypothetical protein [Cellulomonas sp. C5510]QZN86857.1 hypothetical protein K5O09_07035 [Cellulomonas sp. C5510]
MDGPRIELAWIPLGAGGSPVVRFSGRAYEALLARRDHRERCALVHAALLLTHDAGTTVVEVTPVWGQPPGDRGVVAEGPVGARVLGRSRWFRYEVRCWRGGTVPDLAWAVERRTVASGEAPVRALLAAAPAVPRHVWGRDALRCGDMWNSNSVVAWLLAAAGVEPAPLAPPPGRRAPGWAAGVAAASPARPAPGDRVTGP